MSLNTLLRRSYLALETWFFEPVDARIYAAVRISYAVFSLAVVIDLWPIREGLFSAGSMTGPGASSPWFHPLAWVSSTAEVSALMVGLGVVSVCLGLGLFTRACALLLYLWSVSYSTVGYPAEGGYDAVSRIVGLIVVVSPAVRVWSLDRYIFGPGTDVLPRYALRLLQWQLLLIYVCTVWLKAPDAYWRDGSMMAYFMMSLYSRFPSPAWAEWTRLSVLLTWGTLLVEAVVPFLLFNAKYRRLGFLLGFGLHVGIALTSTVALFSLAMLPFYAAFLEPDDFAWVGRWLSTRGSKKATAELAARKAA